MTVSVPQFDDAVASLLAVEANKAGETVETFIGRAVTARLLQQMANRNDQDALATLLRALDGSGLAPADADMASVIADPARLRALFETGLLDAPRDEAYDRIVAMAADALTVPTAAVSLVDHNRQFLFSTAGITGELARTRETPLERSVCQYVVQSGEPLIVEDAREHPVLRNHPAVTDNTLQSYVGMPLTNAAGHSIGTLCVWDDHPRQWSAGHVQILRDLADFVRDSIFKTATI